MSLDEEIESLRSVLAVVPGDAVFVYEANENEGSVVSARLLRDIVGRIDDHRWIRVQTTDDIPDGRWWLTWDDDSVFETIIQRHRFTEDGFRETYAPVRAYMKYFEPKPAAFEIPA